MPTPKVESGIKIPVYNIKGEAETKVTLPKQLQVKVNPTLIAQAYRVQRINARLGTQSTKTRGEVEGSSKKIYRQKGTGRARHGAVRAPIFVGGGIALGPHPRHFEAKIPRKMKRQALLGMLNDKIKAQKLIVLKGSSQMKGKTKEMVQLLKKLNLEGSKILLLLEPELKNLLKATRNLNNVTIKSLNNLSGVDLLLNEYLLSTKESFDKLIALNTTS